MKLCLQNVVNFESLQDHKIQYMDSTKHKVSIEMSEFKTYE